MIPRFYHPAIRWRSLDGPASEDAGRQPGHGHCAHPASGRVEEDGESSACIYPSVASFRVKVKLIPAKSAIFAGFVSQADLPPTTSLRSLTGPRFPFRTAQGDSYNARPPAQHGPCTSFKPQGPGT